MINAILFRRTVCFATLASLLLFGRTSRGQIAVVDSPGYAWYGQSGSYLPFSEGITVSPSADVLVVDLTSYSTYLTNVGFAVNGTPLIQATGIVAFPGYKIGSAIYYLDNPPAGNLTLTGTLGNAVAAMVDYCTLSDVNTTAPVIASSVNGGTSPVSTLSLSGIAAGSFAVCDQGVRQGGVYFAFTANGIAGNYLSNMNSGYLCGADGYVPNLAGGSMSFTGSCYNYATDHPFSVAVFTPLSLGPMTWTGSTNSTWSLSSSDANWSQSALTMTYTNNAPLVFDNTGTNTGIRIASPGVQPASVTFNNSMNPYSFSGASIAGTGAVTLSASAGSVTFSSPNTYTGGTTVTGGTLILANTAGSATGSGNVTLNGGELASSIGAGGSFSGTLLAGTGAHSISPGGDGTVGNLGVGGLTLNNLSTMRFDITSTASYDQISDSGAFTFSGSGSASLLVPGSLPAGTYKLITFGSDPSFLTSDLSLRLIGGGSAPSRYSLAVTAGALDLNVNPGNNSVLSASTSSVAFGRIVLNYIPTTNVSVSLSSGTDATGFSVSANGGATATATGNGPGGIPPSATVTVGLPNATGSYSGTVQVQNTGNDASGDDPSNAGPGQGNAQSPISISVNGTVVDNRVVTSTSASFGLVHVGAALNQGITLATTGDDSHYTRVTVANGNDGFLTVSGGSNPTFNSASVTDNRILSGTAGTTGVFNGTVTLTTGREGLTGESPINVPVNYSVQVFSGSGRWTGSSNGSWSANGNWTDSNGSNIQAAPGTFAGFTSTDSAIFDGSGSGTVIDLTGANPSLNAMSFSNSGYTLSNGSLTLNGSGGTATVTVSSGTQTINTPTTLASNANFAVNGGALLLNSTISGSGSFTKSGTAGLTLAGADTLSSTGPISVTQGTLAAPYGISHGGGGIVLTGGATLQAAGQINRAVSGNGTIAATAELIIGNATQSRQFNQGGSPGVGGTLNVGGNAVILVSADTATLGSRTNIGPGGSLTALNGVQLGNPSSVDSTKVLTATGNAEINANFVNNGLVNGPTGTGQELTFNQAVTGAGSTTGNVEYAASYRPSNSPDAVSVQNVLLDPTSTLIMEFAGDTPGSGYDQLDISGQATLNGTLEVSYLNGFSPSAGESFDLFNGPTTGTFSQISLPALNDGLQWNTGNLYANGTISVTPEPSTLALLATGAIGLAGYASWRRTAARKTAKPAAFHEPEPQDDAPAILSFPTCTFHQPDFARRAA